MDGRIGTHHPVVGAVLTLLVAAALGGCGSQAPSGSGSQPGSAAQPAKVFSLGGVFKVDLHYANPTFGPECPPSMPVSAQGFDLSYRASAVGSDVTFKNLGQGFDLTGTGQPDGMLMLSGGYDMVPGAVHESGTLSGKWVPAHLALDATILFEITPAQGAKVTCNIKASVTGTASPTT